MRTRWCNSSQNIFAISCLRIESEVLSLPIKYSGLPITILLLHGSGHIVLQFFTHPKSTLVSGPLHLSFALPRTFLSLKLPHLLGVLSHLTPKPQGRYSYGHFADERTDLERLTPWNPIKRPVPLCSSPLFHFVLPHIICNVIVYSLYNVTAKRKRYVFFVRSASKVVPSI